MATIETYSTNGGKRYRVRYRGPDRKQTDKRGFTTKREAQLFLATIEVSLAQGQFVSASAGRITVEELASTWISHQSQMKPSSLDAIQRSLRIYVLPTWGPRRVSEIRPSEVQSWVSQISSGEYSKTALGIARPMSATTVLRAHGVLAAILDTALSDRRILANPARGINLPRKTPKSRVYLTHAQVELLALSADDKDSLIRLLAYTGLRWGEAIGIRVGKVDFLRRRVQIDENAVRVGGRIVVGTPKTHERRSVPFPIFLAEPLSALSLGKSRDDLIFGNGAIHLQTPSSRDGWYEKAIRHAQAIDPEFPRVTIHDLRHTSASLAISSGANVKAVQRMLGHKSAAMTLDTYADLFEDDLDAVATALGDARSQANVGKTWAIPVRAKSSRQPDPRQLADAR